MPRVAPADATLDAMLAFSRPGPLPQRSGGTHIHSVAPLPPRILHEVAQRGWLESATLAYLLLAGAALVFVAWAGYGYRARRRGGPAPGRWLRRAGFAGSGALTALLAAAVGVNAYVGYIPTLGSLFGSVTGRDRGSGHLLLAAPARPGAQSTQSPSEVVRIQVGAPRLRVPSRAAFVYLPPGYFDPANAHRRYPVVYLIHGYPGTAMDWFRAGQAQHTMDTLIANRLVQPMIIVSPDVQGPSFTADTECLNAPGGMQLESYVADAVVGAVDQRFRTVANRAGRAIGGMSSGAYCALNIGLHHLHRFSVLLASEPYGDPGSNALHGALRGDQPLWRADSPDVYLPVWHFDVPVAVLFDAGSTDTTTVANAYQLSHLLAAAGQTVAVRVAPHLGHTWWVARLELPYSLVFASQYLTHLPAGGSARFDAAQFARVLAWAGTLPPLAQPRPAPPGGRNSPYPVLPAGRQHRPAARPAAAPSAGHTSRPEPGARPSRSAGPRLSPAGLAG